MEGVPSRLMCFGSGGSSMAGISIGVWWCEWGLTFLDEGGEGGEVSWVFPFRR